MNARGMNVFASETGGNVHPSGLASAFIFRVGLGVSEAQSGKPCRGVNLEVQNLSGAEEAPRPTRLLSLFQLFIAFIGLLEPSAAV
jgi:hypothetical protein